MICVEEGIKHEIGKTKAINFFLPRCRNSVHRATFPSPLFTVQIAVTGDKSQELGFGFVFGGVLLFVCLFGVVLCFALFCLCFGFLTERVVYTQVLTTAEQVGSYPSPSPLDLWGEDSQQLCECFAAGSGEPIKQWRHFQLINTTVEEAKAEFFQAIQVTCVCIEWEKQEMSHITYSRFPTWTTLSKCISYYLVN